MTAQQLVATFSETELSEVCAAINTMQNEAHDATSAVVEQESEAIQVLTKLNRTAPQAVAKSAGSTLKGGDTTHVVPVKTVDKKASTIISVTRLPTTRADQEATRLKCALAKVNAPFGGHRNGMYSVNVDEAPESPPLFATYNLAL